MTVISESVRAPAKVNLCLRICGQRTDGYHLIHSVMAPISLYDELEIAVDDACHTTARQPISLRSDSNDIPSGPGNLAYRAAAAFMSAASRRILIDIHLRKRIPIGSGLGGGSSDAAAVLLALNRVTGHLLQPNELADIGAEIGADVPFFIFGRPARVEGIGDQVTPTNLGPALNLVVCSDGHVLSTAAVYSRLREPTLSLTREPPVSNITAFVEGRRPFTDLLVNDLEEAAALIHPEVLSVKARVMGEGAQAALMSGSGSAVFGVWADRQGAVAAAMRLREQGLWAEAVQTLERSPAVES